MARRKAVTEANRGGSHAVIVSKHGSRVGRPPKSHTPVVIRMPIKYSARDVEVILEALWGMFTESQAQKLVVSLPWDDSEEPQYLALADVAALLESWLDEPRKGA